MISKILSTLNDSVHQEFNFDRPGGKYEISHYCLLAALALAAFYLRILNLGVPGLSGDEDIMGLAVRGLHESGQPVLPSGMEYRRAIVHTYLIYYSTQLFGQSEWALRIPSVVAGMLLLVFVFRIGKRFLDPMHNVAAFSLFALAPPLIEISRTARMYVFLLLLVAIYINFVLMWEHKKDRRYPLIAMCTLAAAISLHPLAIFVLPIFFWPAIASGCMRKLRTAIFVCVPLLAFYWLFGEWSAAPYPTLEERPVYVDSADLTLKNHSANNLEWLRFAIIACALFAVLSRTRAALFKNVPAACLFLGVALVVLRYYLPGGYIILVGALWQIREKEVVNRNVVIVAVLALAIFAADLVNSVFQVGVNRAALRITFEKASPYFWVRLLETFPIQTLVLLALSPVSLLKSPKQEKSSGVILLVLAALIFPMFLLSTFRWDFEYRYLLIFAPLLFILSFALLDDAISKNFLSIDQNHRRTGAMIAAILGIASMQPKSLYNYLTGDISNAPAHKLAAEFVASRQDYSRAIIIAEDSIATYYYLGRLDYRLQYLAQAAQYARINNGRIEDQYTGAEIIGTGLRLRDVLCGSKTTVYIIGDGQVSSELRKLNRRDGISEVLDGPLLKSVFEIQPGPAKVWRFSGQCPADH